MGVFSDSKLLRKIDPTQWALRKAGLNWGNVTHKIRKGLLGSFGTGAANSASSYSNFANMRTANDYKLNTNYRSLRELTGT